MQRYFVSESSVNCTNVTISGDDYHHIVRVMRMNIGDPAIIVFSDEKASISKIVLIENNAVVFEVEELLDIQVELPVKVTIANGLPKGDKHDYILQKSTELGAYSFLPFTAERSIVKWDEKKADKKVDRWKKITKEAAEQSHRLRIPEVFSPVSFEALLNESDTYLHKIVAYEEDAKENEKSRFSTILESFQPGDQVLIVFGPEGGLSAKEIEKLKEAGFQTCGLGPRILRTETAPLYALSAISYYLELMR